ncbi:unnamed protein product [Zymoseptoria tritici ST99CH_1A5]|uniref:Nephrocystin 3-like N-terminal domain-containing protein n=3 Tax=Zymoseptoria tritici TaxID=1047171 RepID=A0A1X7RQI5_ZYMT9|nr:unnamed protein product [Zymoseptoria tritici ST99CH_3D7]SMR50660.1 unnamed protein product [Zymoseptoria tritici ST99CH_1E4]SMR51600.1 unnamed protein product [Zymoseptoria tritici ST99CH_3D1]SMY23362.1 unnamed protein product [Zymoseptoria tritici ST99CH_1A5]
MKRTEDKAYFMMGMFGFYMPPNYGEAEYAFHRLQKEVGSSWTLHIVDERRQKQVKLHRAKLLKSLHYEQMNSRLENIRDAQRKTCEWLLGHSSFTAWTQAHTQSDRQFLLWLSGKPGAGKSTLIKYAYAHAKRAEAENEILVAFFFHARGTELEKSVVGMYRAVLHQIFEAAPDLQHLLDNMVERTELTWPLDRLQRLLWALVDSLGSRRLRCFVDALDECDEESIRDMVNFLDELAQESERLYICFASRHYPTISIRGRRKMILEDATGHGRDLEMYVQRRLEVGDGQPADNIRRQLLKKANGVFMWVVLVVKILNKEYSGGRIFAVQSRL